MHVCCGGGELKSVECPTSKPADNLVFVNAIFITFCTFSLQILTKFEAEKSFMYKHNYSFACVCNSDDHE